MTEIHTQVQIRHEKLNKIKIWEWIRILILSNGPIRFLK